MFNPNRNLGLFHLGIGIEKFHGGVKMREEGIENQERAPEINRKSVKFRQRVADATLKLPFDEM